jgi:heptosyltransferase-1
MPVVTDLLRHYPDAAIDWVVEEAYVDLVRLNGGVRAIIPFALRRWRKNLLSSATRAEMRAFYRALRKETYDLVLDTQGLLKTGAVMGMARMTKGGKRVGLANSTEGSGYEAASRIFHSMSVPVGRRTHAVMRGRLVAAQALGYTIDTPAQFGMRAPDMPRTGAPAWLPDRPYVVFFHATARQAKQWAPANWVRIEKDLAARGMPVLLAWGSDSERQAAERLASQMIDAQVLPKLSMMEAVTLAHRAALAIGVDTGLTHIAAAYNRPTIELYCDSPRWKTEGNWSPNIVNLGDTGTPPSAEEVGAAIASLLGPSGRQST